jgi:hypothetical protein
MMVLHVSKREIHPLAPARDAAPDVTFKGGKTPRLDRLARVAREMTVLEWKLLRRQQLARASAVIKEKATSLD